MQISFKVDENLTLNLTSHPNIFLPNTTTRLLIKAVDSKLESKCKILELGCGTGVVGIALNAKNLIEAPLYASDLSADATNCSKLNFMDHDCVADVRTGSMYEPWSDEKFDVIIDDISGIAEEVANASPWFPGVPCDTGEDGTDLVLNIIKNARHHLTSDGLLFFPVLSLSNVDLILKTAESVFHVVEKLQRIEWPLPEELKEHTPMLKELSSKNLIEFEERFGLVICYTEVYCATQLK